jgi:hypothetical protein
MAQVVDCLPSKHDAPSSSSSAKQQQKNTTEKIQWFWVTQKHLETAHDFDGLL